MRFVEGDERSVEVTWFWCDEGAKPAPYTIFGSGNWASDDIFPWLGPGEVKEAPRKWYNGKNVWGLKGDHHCGTDEEFARGLDHWPRPEEWKWCCCPYVSSFILAVQPPPTIEQPFIGQSGFGSHGPRAERLAWISDACLCLVPSLGSVPRPPVGPYGSSRPGPRRRVAPVWISHACLCVAPQTAELLPARPGPYGSSRPGPRPGRLAPIWISHVCWCVDPTSQTTPRHPAYPYSSSVTGRSAGRPARLPWVSSACLCVSPGSDRLPPRPEPSGGISGHSSRPVSHVSSVCWCVQPFSVVRPHPFTAGSSAAPPAYVSSVCLCVNASSSTGKPPGGYSGVAGSSVSGGGIVTPCCAEPMPTRLYLRFTGVFGNVADVAALTVPLTYNLASGHWEGSYNVYGGTWPVSLRCALPATHWQVDPEVGSSDGYRTVDGQCGPVTDLTSSLENLDYGGAHQGAAILSVKSS